MHYFDLLIRLKTEQEHLFRNIQRNEYHNLFDFIRLDLSPSLSIFFIFFVGIRIFWDLYSISSPFASIQWERLENFESWSCPDGRWCCCCS